MGPHCTGRPPSHQHEVRRRTCCGATLRRRRHAVVPHTMFVPQTMLDAQVCPSQSAAVHSVPHTMFCPRIVEAVPQTMLAAQAEPRRIERPADEALVAPDDLLAPGVGGADSASPGRAVRKKRASSTAPFALRKPAPCVSGS